MITEKIAACLFYQNALQALSKFAPLLQTPTFEFRPTFGKMYLHPPSFS